MKTGAELNAAEEQAGLMIRLSWIGLGLSGAMTLLVFLTGVIKSTFGGTDIFAMALIPLSLASLFSLSALLYGAFCKNAAVEDGEKRLLAGRRENHLLNVEEDVRFTAGRTFANYRRYAPYVITVLAALLTGGILLGFSRYWNSRLSAEAASNPLNAALVPGIMMFISFFAGAFFAGQSRNRAFRWLRPAGGWLIASSCVFLLGAVSLICANYKITGFEKSVSGVLWWIFAVFCGEFVFNFVIEFYRPRTGGDEHPLFESRILSLFTEPGGIMRNLAESLDYQFGFKVSGTWLYGFMEKALFPLLLVWGAVFWLSTSVYEVGPNELGIRERFGKVVSEVPLKSGIYLDLPWPFGNINRFSCDRIYSVNVGASAAHGEDEKTPEVVTWTSVHTDSENMFMVAVPEKNADGGKGGMDSVAFAGLNMPVQYRIRESQLMDFAYGSRDPEQILRRLSEQAATEYLASCSLMHIMSDSRIETTETMKKRIQQLADNERLGVEIVSVNLLDVHPPVEKVAPAFQDVIGAMEKKEASVLEAQAYAVKIVPEAESAAAKTEQEAASYSYRIRTVAEAESHRFAKQLRSYRAMPEMFMLNERLNLLEKDAANIRKFIISSTLNNEIYELNFEEKERFDLVDTDLSTLVEKD